ncbi:MAG TPA: hypothetical protein VF469_30085, partial [Kofleriaceae bacterium]
MGKAFAVAGAIVIVLGGAAIGYAVTRPASGGMSDAQSAAMASAVARLDGDINTARAAVRERASTLSTVLFVRTAVGADAVTAADQVKGGELQFAPKDGEILELGRIVKGTNAVEGLMIQPAGAMHTAHEGMVGSYAELVGEQLVITEVAKVDPQYNAEQYAGFLSVTRPLALGPALSPLVAAGITGQLVLGNKSVPIGKMPAGAATRDQPLGSQKDARLVVAEQPPHAAMPLPILVGGIGAAVIGLLLLIIGAIGKRTPGDTRAFQAMTTQPTTPPAIGNAETQLSQHAATATGTPAPVAADGPGVVPGNLGPGAMIGRWEVVRRLGSGGMADVYLAQAKGDGGFEKLVAIK